MNQMIRSVCLKILFLAATALSMSGCVHLAPLPYAGQRQEARELGKLFKSMATDARNLALNEHKSARELRIILDELEKFPPGEFMKRFDSYTGELIALQKKRQELRQVLLSRRWDSPMVLAIQAGWIEQLNQDQNRAQKWIEMADGVRLRLELGRVADFPELSQLSHQLDIFLASKVDMDPLAIRIQALQEAYNLIDSDFD
jgi:hypothetical protein